MALIFAKHAKKYFGFLPSTFKYRCVKSLEDHVRFENDAVFVDVRYDNGWSYELDVEIGQKGVLFDGKERPFNLGEILRLKGAEKNERYRLIQTRDQDYLIVSIKRLAGLLKIYAKDLLQGIPSAFLSIASLRENEGEEYKIKQELRFVRTEVAKAWDKKDYKNVVKLYTLVEQYITKTERKKMEYAKKHVVI